MKRHSPDIPEVIDPDVLSKLLEATAPVAPPTGLRERVLARAQADRDSYVTVRGDRNTWRALSPGVEFKILLFDTQSHSKSFLLRAAAGSRFPGHAHQFFEECLVLEGELSIGDIHLRAGDFHGASIQATHGEAHTQNGVLVYLRAHIEDYPGIQP